MTTVLVISNVLLWLLVIGLGMTVYALTRQIGVLYERVAPAGALMVNQALKVGDAAPEIAAETLTGQKLMVGKPMTEQKGQLLFFLAPDCPVCKSLLPVLKSMSGSHKSEVDIVLASDGDDLEEHNSYVANHQLEAFPYVISELLGKSYGVGKLPYAVLIRPNATIASLGIVNSREHLESLFEAQALGVASIQDYLAKNQPENNDADALYTDATVSTTKTEPSS